MEGKPLLQSFLHIPEPQYIDSWEEIEGDCGMHPKDAQRDPIAEQAAMQQLIELGYIDKPDENVEKRIENTVNESRFYLARVLMNKNKFAEALPILEDLNEKKKNTVRYAYRLAKCLDSLGRINEASEVVESIIHYEEEIRPIEEINQLKKHIEDSEKKIKEEKEKVKSGENKDPKAEEKIKFMQEQLQRIKNHKKPKEGKREYPQLFLLKGTLEYAKKNYKTALEFLDKAQKADPKLPQLHQQLGNVYLKVRRRNDAEQSFLKALENDPENPQAHLGLAQVYFRKKEYEMSAEYSLNAVGLLYHFPRAHLMLGMALAKLGMYDRAIEAFRVSLKMAPGLIAAHRYLAYIYDIQLKDKEKADIHLEAIKKLREKTAVKE
jgi:tetratricopeptide (TPR) repeat protein